MKNDLMNGLLDTVKQMENDFKQVNTLKNEIDISQKLTFRSSIEPKGNAFKDTVDSLDTFKQKALNSLSIELRTALDSAMASTVWGNDIIDTGNLMNSLRIENNDTTLSIEYTAEYATLVHYGGYIMPYGNSRAKMVYIPGRPWVDSVLFGEGPIPAYDYEEALTRIFDSTVK